MLYTKLWVAQATLPLKLFFISSLIFCFKAQAAVHSLESYFGALKHSTGNPHALTASQTSFVISQDTTFTGITVKFYSDASCATLIGNTITLAPNSGPSIVLSAGTYNSSAATNFALCSLYSNGTTGCGQEFTDVGSVKFTYTYTSPVSDIVPMCVRSSIQSDSGVACPDATSCGFSTSVIAYLPPSYMLFAAASATSGDIKSAGAGSTGVAGADNLCQSYANGVYAGTYKAMIVDGVVRQACASGSGNCESPSENNIDWVMYANSNYVNTSRQALWTTNAAGIYTGSNASNAIPLGGGTLSSVFTGINTNWTTLNTCSTWTSGSGTATVGKLSSADPTEMGQILAGNSAGNCGVPKSLYCVQQ